MCAALSLDASRQSPGGLRVPTHMSLLDAEILPEIDALSPTDRRAWFALRLRPKVKATATNVHLVLAIDRSSSMTGKKLEDAITAARVVVHLLREGDELAVLAFDEHVRVLMPARRMDDESKQAAHKDLLALRVGHGTALFDAAKQSLALASGMAQGHVILITDGFPYSGITDVGDILAMTGDTAGAVTLTTVGVGSELDAALLCAMAGVAGGRFLHLDAGGELLMALGGELATVQDAITGKLEFDVRAARGFAVATAPHYATVGDPAGGQNAASATLAPVTDSDDVLIPFELTWDADLEQREHAVALVTVRVGAPGSGTSQVIEVPVRLRIGAARGAMNGTVTRAVCEIMAGKVLHQAALGENKPAMSIRLLADAAGWIRGRASAAGLDPEAALAPTLRVLNVVQTLFQSGTADAPVIHACAEGVAKRYDASVGSKFSLMEDIRTDAQWEGTRKASLVALAPRRRRE